jgi:glycerol-1-phosphate dehydrogenase [NAD(P)+]
VPLLARMVACPLAVEIREGAVSALPGLLSDGRISAGGHVAVVVGPGQGDEVAAELRTLDVAKYASSNAGLPMVSVATTLAHDGIASPVASLDEDGRKGSYGVQIPIAVVVDLDYVRRAPPEHLRSGIGDALSNLSALADWEIAAADRGDAIDGLASAFARAGAEALLREDEPDGNALPRTLAEALVLSGLAMAVAGSSQPCSGACHEISHAIDALFPEQASHGEQVAVGALFASFLRGGGLFETLDGAYRRHGLASLPRDIGLSDEQFCAAVAEAPRTRPDRYTILERLDLDGDAIRERVAQFTDAVDR